MEKGRGKGTNTLARDNDYLRRGDVKCLLENICCLHEELPAQIDLIPASDVVPVRHGRWVRIDYEPIGHDYICSVCGGKNDRASQYCPDCGALMDMGADCTPVKDGDGE